ncbi:hypothetical protein [Streptomyces sp. 2A115]|uniref:hypothetical protein n=1 Tax=Streptomyces sp. 2A115 TaxID=3457439 RepID=UPI003FD20A55
MRLRLAGSPYRYVPRPRPLSPTYASRNSTRTRRLSVKESSASAYAVPSSRTVGSVTRNVNVFSPRRSSSSPRSRRERSPQAGFDSYQYGWDRAISVNGSLFRESCRYEAAVSVCGTSTGAVATAVSAYRPASGGWTTYAAYQPSRPGFSLVARARYLPPDARRSRTTGMFVRAAVSPCTVSAVTDEVACARAVLSPTADATEATRPAFIAVRLFKPMAPGHTGGLSSASCGRRTVPRTGPQGLDLRDWT